MALKQPGLGAREAALFALEAVLNDDRPLEGAWEAAQLGKLSPRDAGFARMLTMTALRRLGSIDAVIDRFIKRRPVGKDARAVSIMRIAAAELLCLDVAPHAAVDCAVRLAKSRKETRRLSGMVNAVCRRIASDGCAIFDALDADRIDAPAWLWMGLSRAYGEETAYAIAAAHRYGAPLDLTPREDAEGWADRLDARLTPTGSVRLEPRGAVTALYGYEDGAWWAQDAAAALPARMLEDVNGMRVLDLCAAPGGKTMQLAAMGADVLALDISEKRAQRLRENLTRARLSARVIVADALEWEPQTPFDAILLDAPCSATGTIRRHPDLPHRRSGDETNALVPLQDALLDRAWGWLGDNGKLVFATCSLLPEEGEERMKAFLSRTPSARLDPPDWDALSVTPCMVQDGALRTLPSHWPEIGGMDGFFAARFRKI